MAASSSQHRSNSRPRRRVPRPQVFISFRGEEVRDNFVKQLVSTLKFRNINVFIDSFLRGGMRLQHLLTKIEESKIAVVVFSKRYTESDWCMDELVKMDELATKEKLVVIPVFYKVSASDVENLAGEFGKNFEELKEKFAETEPEKVRKWEASVKSVANIKGLLSNNNGRIGPPLVGQIAGVVQEWLNEMPGGKSPKTKFTAVDAFLFNLIKYGFYSLPFYFVAKFSTGAMCVIGFTTLDVTLFYYDNWKNKKSSPPGTRPNPSTTGPSPPPRS